MKCDPQMDADGRRWMQMDADDADDADNRRGEKFFARCAL